eukprot:Gregarina_sp_Poly_1__6274@NODE_332_length_9468_cov_135_874162_g280_i0_p1_GENE_NODE_332_length_9468_cov_135_874162_g280_i0NODE_332_length_9468_cov_135_874162_g280_i0_p1_ORF_typecomplete_len1245_score185_71Minducer_phosp/PF06617_13/0_2_NODE_332_length_9468_cov_135_874162_g280_i046588392
MAFEAILNLTPLLQHVTLNGGNYFWICEKVLRHLHYQFQQRGKPANQWPELLVDSGLRKFLADSFEKCNYAQILALLGTSEVVISELLVKGDTHEAQLALYGTLLKKLVQLSNDESSRRVVKFIIKIGSANPHLRREAAAKSLATVAAHLSASNPDAHETISPMKLLNFLLQHVQEVSNVPNEDSDNHSKSIIRFILRFRLNSSKSEAAGFNQLIEDIRSVEVSTNIYGFYAQVLDVFVELLNEQSYESEAMRRILTTLLEAPLTARDEEKGNRSTEGIMDYKELSDPMYFSKTVSRLKYNLIIWRKVLNCGHHQIRPMDDSHQHLLKLFAELDGVASVLLSWRQSNQSTANSKIMDLGHILLDGSLIGMEANPSLYIGSPLSQKGMEVFESNVGGLEVNYWTARLQFFTNLKDMKGFWASFASIFEFEGNSSQRSLSFMADSEFELRLGVAARLLNPSNIGHHLQSLEGLLKNSFSSGFEEQVFLVHSAVLVCKVPQFPSKSSIAIFDLATRLLTEQILGRPEILAHNSFHSAKILVASHLIPFFLRQNQRQQTLTRNRSPLSMAVANRSPELPNFVLPLASGDKFQRFVETAGAFLLALLNSLLANFPQSWPNSERQSYYSLQEAVIFGTCSTVQAMKSFKTLSSLRSALKSKARMLWEKDSKRSALRLPEACWRVLCLSLAQPSVTRDCVRSLFRKRRYDRVSTAIEAEPLVKRRRFEHESIRLLHQTFMDIHMDHDDAKKLEFVLRILKATEFVYTYSAKKATESATERESQLSQIQTYLNRVLSDLDHIETYFSLYERSQLLQICESLSQIIRTFDPCDTLKSALLNFVAHTVFDHLIWLCPKEHRRHTGGVVAQLLMSARLTWKEFRDLLRRWQLKLDEWETATAEFCGEMSHGEPVENLIAVILLRIRLENRNFSEWTELDDPNSRSEIFLLLNIATAVNSPPQEVVIPDSPVSAVSYILGRRSKGLAVTLDEYGFPQVISKPFIKSLMRSPNGFANFVSTFIAGLGNELLALIAHVRTQVRDPALQESLESIGMYIDNGIRVLSFWKSGLNKSKLCFEETVESIQDLICHLYIGFGTLIKFRSVYASIRVTDMQDELADLLSIKAAEFLIVLSNFNVDEILSFKLLIYVTLRNSHVVNSLVALILQRFPHQLSSKQAYAVGQRTVEFLKILRKINQLSLDDESFIIPFGPSFRTLQKLNTKNFSYSDRLDDLLKDRSLELIRQEPFFKNLTGVNVS